jgi:hypothetical protein
MIYYMIRHKATGEFMPELKRTRGYSYWNPSKADTVETLKRKLTGCPRLFSSRRKAVGSIAAWNAFPNSRQGSYQSYDGEWDDRVDIKPDGRSKEDLEIVEVDIIERGNEL